MKCPGHSEPHGTISSTSLSMSKVQDSKVTIPVMATAVTTTSAVSVLASSSHKKNNNTRGTGSNNIAIINRVIFPPRKITTKKPNPIVSNRRYHHQQHHLSKSNSFQSHHSHTRPSHTYHYHPYRYHSHQVSSHSSEAQVRYSTAVAPFLSKQPTESTSRSGTTTTTTKSSHEAVTKKDSSSTTATTPPTSSSITKMAPLDESRSIINNIPDNNLLTNNNRINYNNNSYDRDTPTNELVTPECDNFITHQGQVEGMKRISPYPNHHFQYNKIDGRYPQQQHQPPPDNRYHYHHQQQQHHHENEYQHFEDYSADEAGPHHVMTTADTPLRSNQSSRPSIENEDSFDGNSNALYISNSHSQDEYDSSYDHNYYSSTNYHGDHHHHQQQQMSGPPGRYHNHYQAAPQPAARRDRGWRSGMPRPGYPQVNGENYDWYATPPAHHQQQHYHRFYPQEYYYPTAPPPLMTAYSSDTTEEYQQHAPSRHPYELWQEGSDETIPPPSYVDDGSYYSQYHHHIPAFYGPHGPPQLQEYNHHSKMIVHQRQMKREGPHCHEGGEEKDMNSPSPASAVITTPRTPSSNHPSARGEGYPRKVTPSSSSSNNTTAPGSDGRQEEGDYDSLVVTGDNVTSPERGDGTISSTEAASTASTPQVSNTSKKTGSTDIITADEASIAGSSGGPVKFVTLQDQDVVCGRGAPTEYHIGNAHFRDLVRSYHTSYFCAKRSDKPQIAMKVLDILESRGARFVRREKTTRATSPGAAAGGTPLTSSSSSSCWVVVSRKLAYEKVCQSLRDGAPEVQRQMLSSSQKIREAVKRERMNESGKHQKIQENQQHEQCYHVIESHGSMTDYSDYNNIVASAPLGPGDHDKENGYPPGRL